MNTITHAIAAAKMRNLVTGHYTPEFTVACQFFHELFEHV